MTKYRVEIKKDEDGYFTVKVPDLPGCFSDGETREEALENIKEAIKCQIEALKKDNEGIPEPSDYAEVEVYA